MKLFKKKNADYYLLYTIVFLLMCAIVFSYFYLNDKTFINHLNDGLIQHYKALIYYSEYLRTILKNLFVEHKVIIPQWDFSIGEGADILQTLHMYAIGDPLAVLSVFFPREKIYIWYDLSIILRLYLAGIFFSILCFYTGRENRYGVLVGSLIYVFCFWNLLNANEHIYFLNPMLYLPLIVLGIEKIIRNEKPYLFCLAVFVSAISNFYFFYMLVILTVIYVAVRLLIEYGRDYKALIDKLLKIFVFALLGTMMAAVILFPVLGAFVSDSRVSADSVTKLFYGRLYYERLFAVLLSDDFEYDLCMGFASAIILSGGLVAKDKRKYGRLLLCLNIIVFIMICLPICGKIMNGFAYPINRWSFAIALVAAYSLVYEWDELKTNGRYLLVFMFVVFAIAMLSSWSRTIRVLVPVVLCAIFYFVSQLKKDRMIRGFSLKECLLVGIIILNILFIADQAYSERGSNRIVDASSREEVLYEINSSDAAIYRDILGGSEFFRYGGNSLNVNAAMLEDTHSVDFYWSVTNPAVISFREKLGINDFTSYMYRGYDDRAALLTLASGKYFLGYEGEYLLPYGFVFKDNRGGRNLYENEHFLPFGYTYEKTLSYEKWNELDQIEKQMVLLDRIVVEGGKDDYVSRNFRKDVTISSDGNIEIENKRLIVKEEKSDLYLDIIEPANGEYDVSFAGLYFEDTDSYIEGNRDWVHIKVNDDREDERRNIYYFTPDYQFYSGRHDFTVSFGYLEEGPKQIRITFPYPGIYTFDDLFVSCVDYDNYDGSLDKLRADVLQNVVFEDDRISGKIAVDSDKYLLLSIPYAKGWKAYVDGEERELLKANECYMALSLEKGEHQIELKYQTPLANLGLLVSVLSFAALASFFYFDRKGKISL